MTWTRGRLLGVASAVVAVLLAVTVAYVLPTRAELDLRVTPASLQCIRPSDEEWKPVPYVIDTNLVPAKGASSTAAFADPGEPRRPGFWITADAKDLQCVLVVYLTNDGPIPVRVRDVVFEGWADEPSTRDDWVAFDDTTRSPVRSVGEDRQGAAYVVDRTLGEGDFVRVEMGFERRPGVCRGGNLLTLQDPEVRVSTLGWRTTIDSGVTVATWFPPSVRC